MQDLNFKNVLLKQKENVHFMNVAKQNPHVALNICCTYFCFFLFRSVYCVFYMVSAQSYNSNKICVCDYFGISWKSSRLKAQCSCHHVSPYKDWYRERSWVRMTVQVYWDCQEVSLFQISCALLQPYLIKVSQLFHFP